MIHPKIFLLILINNEDFNIFERKLWRKKIHIFYLYIHYLRYLFIKYWEYKSIYTARPERFSGHSEFVRNLLINGPSSFFFTTTDDYNLWVMDYSILENKSNLYRLLHVV